MSVIVMISLLLVDNLDFFKLKVSLFLSEYGSEVWEGDKVVVCNNVICLLNC